MRDKDWYESMVALVDSHGGIRPAARELGVPESTLRSQLKGYEARLAKENGGHPGVPDHGFVPGETGPTHIDSTNAEVDRWGDADGKGGVRRYILTSAQNNVEVDGAFMDNLEAFAAEMNAEIMVSYVVYDAAKYRGVVRKGETKVRESIWWDRRVEPYAVNVRTRLAPRLVFCGELDLMATMKSPLSGLESYSGRDSIIVPHNRFAMRCVESRHGHYPKEMHTTGSVTNKRFVARKAGQLAAFHHIKGALLVEVVSDGRFWVHTLNADDDGSFFWMDKWVDGGKVHESLNNAPAVVLGDIHAEKCRYPQIKTARKILDFFKPRIVVLHDLLDFTSRNHHVRGDPVFRAQNHLFYVHDDFRRAYQVLEQLSRGHPTTKFYEACSNHDEALIRWIKETDWRTDPMNAGTYLALAQTLVLEGPKATLKKAIEMGAKGEPIPDITFLGPNDSLEVEGIELGMHGHIGLSGARGSPAAFAKLGFKSITAHSHTPGIIDGCYTVGVTGNLDMGYNKGPSKWMHAHCVIYPNGKRALIYDKDGEWRAHL